jgi:hypothetical protein
MMAPDVDHKLLDLLKRYGAKTRYFSFFPTVAKVVDAGGCGLARIYGFIGFFRPPGFSDYHLWLRTYSRKARTAALVCRRLG